MNASKLADSELPGFDAVLGSLFNQAWRSERHSGMEGAIQRATAYQVLQRLLEAQDAERTDGPSPDDNPGESTDR